MRLGRNFHYFSHNFNLTQRNRSGILFLSDAVFQLYFLNETNFRNVSFQEEFLVFLLQQFPFGEFLGCQICGIKCKLILKIRKRYPRNKKNENQATPTFN